MRSLRFVIGVFAIALALLTTAWVGVAARFATLVVTPNRRRTYDVRIQEVCQRHGQTFVRLPRTADTELLGSYTLITADSGAFVNVGPVVSADATSVERELLDAPAGLLTAGEFVRFTGWWFRNPNVLPERPHSTEVTLGGFPAWKIWKATETDRWAVHVHGRTATRQETLRGVPAFLEAGFTNLVVTYRNDQGVQAGRNRRFALGSEEWRDVEHAVHYAIRQGAQEIVLVGWSMGASICLQLLDRSVSASRISAVMFDSPALDWNDILRYHAKLSRLPAVFAGQARVLLQRGIVRSGAPGGIPFDRMSATQILRRHVVPILILHSADDGYVPIGPSQELARALSQNVKLEVFREARHCKLWNIDSERYRSVVTQWLRELG